MASQEDNIYRGSTFYMPLGEPAEQRSAREREAESNEAMAPALEKAVEILRAHIAAYNTLPAIPDGILNLEDKEALAFRNQVAINKQTVANLLPITQELEDIVAEYKR